MARDKLFFIGVILTVIGIIIMLMAKLKMPLPPWRLPGDILIKKENFTLYLPITTCIVLSLILSLIAYLFS